MQQLLTEAEARVIGCLIEKSVVTPDQYPMTLNALTNACNQKTARDPVMSMTQGEVGQAGVVLTAVRHSRQQPDTSRGPLPSTAL